MAWRCFDSIRLLAAEARSDDARTFPADEVVVVTPPGEEANWLEKDACSPMSSGSPPT